MHFLSRLGDSISKASVLVKTSLAKNKHITHGMAQKSPEILVRPKCHDLSPIPLNILILDDQNEDLKSVIDQDKYTVHVGPLDEHYVSKCQKF